MSKMSRKLKIASLTIVIGLVLTLACAVSFGGSGMRSAGAAGYAVRYTSDYASKAEAIEAGAKLNDRIAEEGMVLLKNEGKTLPLDPGGKGSDATGVTLFGYKSVKPEGGASPNDTDASAGMTIITSDFYTSLAMAGYRTNPVVKAAYNDWISEDAKNALENDKYVAKNTCDYAAKDAADTTGIKKFTEDVAFSFSDYSDAAIVVLSGTGAAATDGGRKLVDKAAGTHVHQLDSVQKALLAKVAEMRDNKVFGKLIVLINDSTPMELKEIHDAADAVLLVGNPGASGFNAVGKILSGEVNPSGRTVDIYPTDLTKDPTFDNVDRNYIQPVTKTVGKVTTTEVAGGNQYVDEKGNPLFSYFADYEEGIYVGYRYYETMAEQLKTDDADWYDDNVVYPFGTGGSYTNFDWTVTAQGGAITDADQKISVNVKVENKGDVSGKDVVELYYSAPYTADAKLEKSAVVLGDFAKTDEIAASSNDTVTLSLKARDMASYDVNANSGKGAYVLEKGDYKISLRTDSHNVKTGSSTYEYTFNVAEKIVITTSDQTGKEISNAFDDNLAGLSAKDNSAERLAKRHPGAKGFKELSRDDMKASGTYQPQRRSLYNYDENDEKRATGDAAANNVLDLTKHEYDDWTVVVDNAKDTDKNGIIDYDEGKPWAVAKEDMPKYAASEKDRPAKAEVMLSQLIGKGYDDPLWEKLLDQLTLDEMIGMVQTGGFKSNAIPYIGKPETLDTDSPLGWSGNGTAGATMTKFATAPVMASTWSKELAYEMGKMIGDQGLWGRSDTGTSIKAYTGWYGPGMNTHRSPFLSRYTEYYSEDGYLAGMMAANATLGAAEKGCYSFIKHFALHEDGSTDRGIFTGGEGSDVSGLSIWVSEQAMREIYLKPFQIATEVGGATAAMASFSRIGSEWAGGSYGLLTKVLRDEWGFEGMVVTDIAIYDFLNVEQMIRAGDDMVLDASVYQFPPLESCNITKDNLTATKVTALRNTSKHVLFTVANSNAMQIPLGAAVKYQGTALDDAVVGTAYTANVTSAALNTVYGFDATIRYTLTGGELPAGLKFSNGIVSGTPARAGVYSFTVTASTDGFASCAGTFTVAVDPAKTTEDIVNGSTDDLNGKIDGAVGDLNTKIEATDGKIGGVNTVSIIALIFAIIAAGASVAVVVLLVLKKK